MVAVAAFAIETLTSATPALAQASGEFVTRAKRAILMDADSGAVLYQQNADELAPPASMSKLMTLEVLFQAMKQGKVKPEDEFLMSEYAWRTGGAPSGTSAMFVPINTRARVDELIQGIIVQSGNDASIAVAEALGGSEQGFAKMMEAEARRIGLAKSTFRNSTGLHDPEHLMTARELAILARHIIREHPEHYKIFAQREFPYRKHKFFNRNPLLGDDALGVDGLKTGHTKEAGYGIVVSSVSEGRRLIGVVMGLADEKERREEARRLLEWGQRSFAKFTLFDADEEVGHARIWGGTQFYVPLSAKGGGPLNVVLPRFPANQKLRAEIVYNGPLKPPVKKGDEIARLRVTSSSNASTEVPLVATEDVEPANLWRRGMDSLVFLALRWANL
ncbi:MAG: D-alanyl-D-alanine carboxypeptidase [Hyphomicrobium sp. 32-62-53]|nr:MAG: D-alanyl-D-alanine carboxypeptidase [Hyphomicrobium sp. 12-62-95]OYX98222.1 MAG: D-alanyl-D-alanine carboxypeptidase [Hyphomicrobium sp. 32-62-53]